jgi:hypothetical protein
VRIRKGRREEKGWLRINPFTYLPASLTILFSLSKISNIKLIDTLNALKLDSDDKGFFKYLHHNKAT